MYTARDRVPNCKDDTICCADQHSRGSLLQYILAAFSRSAKPIIDAKLSIAGNRLEHVFLPAIAYHTDRVFLVMVSLT